MILALRTDTFDAHVSLVNANGEIIRSKDWAAGRQLSVDLPIVIDELLSTTETIFKDLSGVVVYEGPGSFTGLRIGMTIANTIAHEQNIPIVGSTGDDWLQAGLAKLSAAKPGAILTPVYGGEANISKPRK